MHAITFRPALLRQGLALAMALVVAFLGVAVFSSLHTHQGAKNRCSLNGYDQLMTGETEAAQAAEAASPLERIEARAADAGPDRDIALVILLRGPPAAV